MDAFARIADSRIQAAIARGEFDDLPGKGEPLPPDALARVPAQLRMGLRILRNADACRPSSRRARSRRGSAP